MCAKSVGHSNADVRTWLHNKQQVCPEQVRCNSAILHSVSRTRCLFISFTAAFLSHCLSLNQTTRFLSLSLSLVLSPPNHITHRDNMGRRLMRLVDKPRKLDKIFMPRGVTPTPSKRPSPPVSTHKSFTHPLTLSLSLILALAERRQHGQEGARHEHIPYHRPSPSALVSPGCHK